MGSCWDRIFTIGEKMIQYNTLINTQLCEEIRKEIDFCTEDKEWDDYWFRSDEQERILKHINPEFNHEGYTMHDKLPHGVPGWARQRTVGSHPDRTNLIKILSLIKQAKEEEKKSLSPHAIGTANEVKVVIPGVDFSNKELYSYEYNMIDNEVIIKLKNMRM